MITLITGAPGTGKSAALVDLLAQLVKGRALYVDGVPELAIEHQPLPDPRKWHLEVPDGAAIVIDEVQRVWRPRGPGQKVPDDIAALETHRHRGLDFFIVTQAPSLLDKNVRGLVGRHVHLRDVGILGRHWYEWPECNESPSTAWKTCQLKKRYRLPKKVFGLYKSASLHVKPIRSFPTALIVAALAVTGVVVGVGMTWRNVQQRMSASEPMQTKKAAQLQSGPEQQRPAAARQSDTDPRMRFVARVPDDPGTAPAYDHLRIVTVAPRIIGGYCRAGRCRCFTQQVTDPGIGNEACRTWIASPPFDPYRVESPRASEAIKASPRSDSDPAQAAPGTPLAVTPDAARNTAVAPRRAT